MKRSTSALSIDQLTVNYGHRPALFDISLDVPVGQLVAIVGPNGAGKSTFIQTVMGLMVPVSGRIEILGQPLEKVKKQVAYVPQRGAVDWDFPISVREVVLMGRYGRMGLLERPKKADWAAVDDYLRVVGIEGLAARQISELSVGQQQRVFIARALMQEADVYFMDEPFAGVDLATEATLKKVLQTLTSKGKTVFVVIHDLKGLEETFNWAILLNTYLVSSDLIENAITPATLNRAYGRNYALLDEALKLSLEHR